MNFTELTCCPFCGNEEFYTKLQFRGSCWYNERFDGNEADNTEMYDGLLSYGGDKAYCNNCNKYLGNRTKNIVSKEVENTISEVKGVNNQ